MTFGEWFNSMAREHSWGAGAYHSLLTLGSFTTACQTVEIYLYPDWLGVKKKKKITFKCKNSWKTYKILSPGRSTHSRILVKFKNTHRGNLHDCLAPTGQSHIYPAARCIRRQENEDATLCTMTISRTPVGAPHQNFTPLHMTSEWQQGGKKKTQQTNHEVKE